MHSTDPLFESVTTHTATGEQGIFYDDRVREDKLTGLKRGQGRLLS